MPLEEISCLLKKCSVLSQENISCRRKQFPVTVRNFLSHEKLCCHGKQFFLWDKGDIFPLKQYVLPVRLCVPPFAISIYLLFTNSIFPATRTLFLIRERLVFSIKLGSSQVYQIFATNAQDSQSKLDDKQTASVTFETLMNNFLNTLDTLLIH